MRGGGAVAELFWSHRVAGGIGGDYAPGGCHAGGGDCRRRVAGRGETTGRSGHCGNGSAEFWIGAELWRAVRGRGGVKGKVCTADAGAAGGANDGSRRAAWVCVDA